MVMQTLVVMRIDTSQKIISITEHEITKMANMVTDGGMVIHQGVVSINEATQMRKDEMDIDVSTTDDIAEDIPVQLISPQDQMTLVRTDRGGIGANDVAVLICLRW